MLFAVSSMERPMPPFFFLSVFLFFPWLKVEDGDRKERWRREEEDGDGSM
jgi:hypothetical protein